MNRALLTLAVSVCTACLAAQNPFEPSIGNPQGAGEDTISGPFALGFTFPAPGGVQVTDIEVDSNGRVIQTGTDGSDFSETVAELLGRAGWTICPYWDDLSFTAPSADDLYFNALPGKAVITWKDVTLFSGTDPFTMQVQLFPDGSIRIVYDQRTPDDEPIVGLSAGNGAADPGESDLTAGPTTAVPDLYEDFAYDCDFTSGWLDIVPNAAGGYDVRWTAADFAAVTAGRRGYRDVRYELTATPDGAGGYDVVTGGTLDAGFATGTALNLGDDSLSGPLALSFAFPAPGGGVASSIEVDSNGRVIETGSDFSDFSESVAELLGNPGWSICPLWNDMDPSAGGRVWFRDNGTHASVTWDGVPQFGETSGPLVQVRLFDDGSVQFLYRAMLAFVETDAIIGLSAGSNVADPGESDLSGVIATAGRPVCYEFFDVLGGDRFGFVDPPELVVASLPVIGASFELQMAQVPSGTLQDFFLYGVATFQDLTALRIGLDGNFLLSDGLILTTSYAPGVASIVPIPNDAALAGLAIECQGVTFTPGFNPGAGAFTDSVTARLGY